MSLFSEGRGWELVSGSGWDQEVGTRGGRSVANGGVDQDAVFSQAGASATA